MEVGQVGSAIPTTATFGPQGPGRGGKGRQSAPTGQATLQTPGIQTAQPRPSTTTAALQQVNQDLDSLTGKLDDLIGALTKFIDARKEPTPPPFNPDQPQNPSGQNQPPAGTQVADPNQVTPQSQNPAAQSPAPGTPPANQPPGNQTPPPAGTTPSVEVAGNGDININIVINVDPGAGAGAGAGASGAGGAGGAGGAAAPPPPEKPVKVEIVEPPPPPPPPPPPTNVTTSDFGSISINGKQTFLGTVFGIFYDPPKAADYIAGVLNANTDNGGITASITNEGRVVLTSKTPGANILINDLQAESDGDPFNNAVSGFKKGQQAAGTLTGDPVSLFDPTKIDNSDPNRPPVLRGT